MSKKKKEHVTFDRLADNRPRINPKAYIRNQEIKHGLLSSNPPVGSPQVKREHLPKQ